LQLHKYIHKFLNEENFGSERCIETLATCK
jgi:hypothetical protein